MGHFKLRYLLRAQNRLYGRGKLKQSQKFEQARALSTLITCPLQGHADSCLTVFAFMPSLVHVHVSHAHGGSMFMLLACSWWPMSMFLHVHVPRRWFIFMHFEKKGPWWSTCILFTPRWLFPNLSHVLKGSYLHVFFCPRACLLCVDFVERFAS